MAAKNKFMNAMKMPAIADMFSSEADRQRESGDLVTEVPLVELHPFVNHPFEVRDDEDMQKLVDSIKENGVLTNLTVRRRAEGGYETAPPPCVILSPNAATGTGLVTVNRLFSDHPLMGFPVSSRERTCQK